MDEFQRNQTLLRAQTRLAFSVQQSIQSFSLFADTYNGGVYGKPKLFSAYTLGERELRRDRRQRAQ